MPRARMNCCSPGRRWHHGPAFQLCGTAASRCAMPFHHGHHHGHLHSWSCSIHRHRYRYIQHNKEREDGDLNRGRLYGMKSWQGHMMTQIEGLIKRPKLGPAAPPGSRPRSRVETGVLDLLIPAVLYGSRTGGRVCRGLAHVRAERCWLEIVVRAARAPRK